MNVFKSFFRRAESGQALVEYWPTIPAAIAIMISAGAITNFLNNAFLKTADSLGRVGLSMEVCNSTSDSDEGPDEATDLGDHTIDLTAVVYDPVTDTTTVTYHVVSGSQPSISHWVLAIPKSMADLIIDESEPWEWTDSDPTTGTMGIKFDTGYEGGDAGGPPDKEDKDNGKGKPKLRPGIQSQARMLAGTFALISTGEARDIVMLFSGELNFTTVEVTVKAGTESNYSTISAPTSVVTEEVEEPTNPFNGDNQHIGCS